MADSLTPQGDIVRCPVCLAAVEVPRDSSGTAPLTCPKCGRAFMRGSGIAYKPPVTLGDALLPSTAPAAVVPESTLSPVPLYGGLIALSWLLFYFLTKDLRGPEFLGYYFCLFLVTWGGAVLVRASYPNHDGYITWSGVLIFEGAGVIRLIIASMAGMQRFTYLILMMLFGALFYFIRAQDLGSGRSSNSGCSGGMWFSSCSSSSSGSSCGSGGGCGGGGGGCGGCGGG